MTEKLYYQDSHLKEFWAGLLSWDWNEDRDCYEIVLDRTAFFPEGGGQYADTGTLGGYIVEDVQEKEDGTIVHYCTSVTYPLIEGTRMRCFLNYEERFRRMQQHSGEHIVSGLVHKHFGYDNVGFHLGEKTVTMDYNGPLTEEQLRMIEKEANEAVSLDIEVQTSFPSREELKQLDYRSKKELEGQVRIVTIPGYDTCACCAPHVSRTGEIGLIKLTDAIKYKGGTRVSMVCGFRALDDYQEKEDNVKEISRLLSAKPSEVAAAVSRLQKESHQLKERLYHLQEQILEKRLDEIPEDGSFLLFEEDLDKNAARHFVDTGMRRCNGICGIFLGNDTQGYQYILGSQTRNMRELLKTFHDTFPGKGGGKPEMVQGAVTGNRADIEAYWKGL